MLYTYMITKAVAHNLRLSEFLKFYLTSKVDKILLSSKEA
jgi:hypothetical protein